MTGGGPDTRHAGAHENEGARPSATPDDMENHMLQDRDAVANLAVKDMEAARKFYEGALGLEPVGAQGGEVIVYRSGKTRLNVYRSKEAGTNKATAVTWAVGDDLEAIVEALKSKGVTFEHYDMPGLALEGDLHVGYGMKVAWFKDPDGNILNLINQ
jgi:catechol 2,3-dioxygenase-like lactoylglutathione lyase family enzyme